MIQKILAFILSILVTYVLAVFLFPEFADTYGSRSINTSIRALQSQISHIGSPESSGSILDQIKGVGDNAQEIVDQTVDVAKEKIEQGKKAKESVENAYKAVDQAKTDIQNLGRFSSGNQQ